MAAQMDNRKLLRTGIIGFVVTMVCCFTPLLVLLFGAAGLTAWLEGADFVLFPAMFGFMALSAYALIKRRRAG